MKRRKSSRVLGAALLAGSILAISPLASAAPGDEQGQARRDMRAGNVRPLREIEQRVLPSMPGMQYLGPEYDPTAMAYRLKFIQNGRVVFVDVDARSGQILSRH
ncbi:PepSY domain-containing protein [Novosphingobium flavum]|uniref:PepSY domain-containing protein n=1 Tax=Novosphingobium flavum TaxID=1778672 RepID=A0A7X1FQ30_9SPHN|nr:PepSY domain-containing protein [Novosphingobium flavum]MBC2664894.1 PepSY domain-containing protein [Novosphingobium flavum]